MIFPSRNQLIRDLSLTRTDQMEISKRRGDPHRLGFAYQLGFVRVFQRFPVQQPLEICEELLSFVALQTGIDGGLLGDYASWQQTVSRHQIRIRGYLGLRSFDPGQERGLEQFLYEELCRLEQTAALLARAREYLKQEKTVFPAESVLRRIIGEQRRKARDAIAARVAEELPLEVGETLDKLLEVEAGETVSGLQGIKKNPAKPSAVAMRRLAERLTLIEATGVLGMDLEWLNRNYQRALFQYVRNCSAPRLRKLARPRRWTALVCFLRQSYLRNRNVRLRESCEWPPSRPTREFIAVAAFGRQLRESDALRSPTPRQSSNLRIRFLVDAFARPQHLVAT